MAEYVIMLEEDGSANVQGTNFAEIRKEINLKSIKNRWSKLLNHLTDMTLPERDYERQYSNKEILRLCKAGELNKTDTKTVESKLHTGNTKKPLLKKGDWRCAYCDYSDKCWGNNPEVKDTDVVKLVKPVVVSLAKISNKKNVTNLEDEEVF
jgi:hypothetical protein